MATDFPDFVSIHGHRLGLTPRGLQVDDLLLHGLNHAGKRFFVDPANGDDNRDGLSPLRPLASLTQAQSNMTAGKNDIAYLMGDGSTAATNRITETLTWSKNATHLIGITAPTGIANRARISHASTAPTTAFDMVKVTADGCIFSNFSLFEGFNETAAAAVTWEDEGQRNYYSDIHFGGMGSDGDSGDAAASACLLLDGGGEHRFDRCTFGLDTVARGAANANIRIRNGSARNQFFDCTLLASCDAGSPLFVDTNAANSLGRWVKFVRCDFLNALNISPGATEMADAVSFHANQNGTVLLNACASLNVGDWGPSDSALLKLINMPATSGETGGQYVSNDAS